MFARKLLNSLQAPSGTEQRPKKKTALREALRNRGGAALEAHYTDVADRLGLDEPQSYTRDIRWKDSRRSEMRRALKARGGVQRTGTPSAVPDSFGEDLSNPAQGASIEGAAAESACSDFLADVIQEARGPALPKRTFRVVRRSPPAPVAKEPDDSTCAESLDGWRGQHWCVPEPKASDVMQGRFRRCCSDLEGNTQEIDWTADRAKRVKDLREFWNRGSEAKTPTGTPKMETSKDEQSKVEAKALMTKILASGEKVDLDKVRRLRKVILEFEREVQQS